MFDTPLILRKNGVTPFGAWHCFSFAQGPYRPYMPWPEFYRVLGYGEAELVREPDPGEGVLEVAIFALEEACWRLRGQDAIGWGAIKVELFRLAAALRAGAG